MTTRPRKSTASSGTSSADQTGAKMEKEAKPDQQDAEGGEVTESSAPVQGPAGATEVVAEAVLGPEDHAVSAVVADSPLGPAHDTDGDATSSGSDDGQDGGRDDVDEKSGTRYLNTSGGPLTYTEDGRQVDTDDWTPPVNLDRIGRAARDRGHLKSRTALGLT